MGALEALLARVADPALRADLEREIAPLRVDQTLGLVFERHLPERVRLYGHPIRRGLTVEKLSSPEGPPWQVVTTENGAAHLRRQEDIDGTVEDTVALEDLVVVRQFGERIYPGLRSVGTVARGNDRAFHTVINAENYHALETLLYTCEGQVDAVFIDPPYNTGARDWTYNNDYVDADDSYRHSKWLAMMERRLQVAARLMNRSESVLIVSIDENEVHRLVLLLERIFPSSKIQMVTALINPAGASIIDQFSRVDEHLLFVHVGSARPMRSTANTTPTAAAGSEPSAAPRKFQWESFQRSGGNSHRQDTKAKFFAVYIDPQRNAIVGCSDSLPENVDRSDAPTPPKGAIAQWPIKTDGSEACWQLSPATFRNYLKDGRVRLGRRNAKTGRWGISFLTKGHLRAIEAGELIVTGRDSAGAMIVENAEGRERSQVGKTMWTNGAYSATEHGSTLLRRFLPRRRFPFPKSLYLVEDALRYYIGDKPDALVLDFFAGSGTTAHAVFRLNRADTGKRRTILVTNNEVGEREANSLRKKGLQPTDDHWKARGIFDLITRPRIEAALTGQNSDGDPIEGSYRFTDPFPMAEGFEENVEFFELTYEDKDRIRLGAAFEAIAPLLWLKAGARGPRINEIERPWTLPTGGRYGVLFDVNEWSTFVQECSRAPDLRFAFVVTDSTAVFQRVSAELPQHVEAARLYESYLASFELNGDDRR